ncbi:MAG: hypothetical protein IJC18_00480 [Clostridia bacterium]|nr:hypothetical protein [Clostridia bacterium]
MKAMRAAIDAIAERVSISWVFSLQPHSGAISLNSTNEPKLITEISIGVKILAEGLSALNIHTTASRIVKKARKPQAITILVSKGNEP